jgi:prepilin-type N-terminal cleavage/methylation domain-containing protein
MRRNPLLAQGFTLMELLVVIAIIGAIAALLLPVFAGARRKAQRATCISNLGQIAFGVRMYSDDSQDAAPSPGGAGLTSTNLDPLYVGYKALIKNYVGANGASSPRDKLFQCPADTFYPTWFGTNSTWPSHFVQKSAYSEPFFDHSSYVFNGGDNTPRKYGKMTPAYPGLSGVKLIAVKHPSRTVLVGEVSAFAPFSWHAPSSHGTANVDGTLYNDSKNVVSFVDGHASYIKMYWQPAQGLACWYDPPTSYDYQWSPN